MKKRWLLVAGLVLLVALGLLAFVYRGWLFRPNFDRVGGTEIVFAIEPASLEQGGSADDLCRALERRLDPSGMLGIVAVLGEGNEVIVRVPRGPTAHAELVEGVLAMVAVQGTVEFLIVANDRDDSPAMAAARETFRTVKAEERDRLEKENLPPPPPRDVKGKTTFAVALPGHPESAYRWAELGKAALYTYRLNSAALDEMDNADLKRAVDEAMRTGEPFQMQNGLLHVRAIHSWERRAQKDREQGKTREFFLLMREAEKGKGITGDQFVKVFESKDSGGKASVEFTLNEEAGKHFLELTTRNRPEEGEGGFARHLAILVDGMVMSAPRLQTPIGRHGQITGDFTETEVNELVRILRAGALPCRLKPDPVRMHEVPPRR